MVTSVGIAPLVTALSAIATTLGEKASSTRKLLLGVAEPNCGCAGAVTNVYENRVAATIRRASNRATLETHFLSLHPSWRSGS
jgi:hypothetical protein